MRNEKLPRRNDGSAKMTPGGPETGHQQKDKKGCQCETHGQQKDKKVAPVKRGDNKMTLEENISSICCKRKSCKTATSKKKWV